MAPGKSFRYKYTTVGESKAIYDGVFSGAFDSGLDDHMAKMHADGWQLLAANGESVNRTHSAPARHHMYWQKQIDL